MVKLFVYGTLRKGMGNHPFIAQHDVEVETAFVRGTMYVNGLPYYKNAGNDMIKGDLVTFKTEDISCLKNIDNLEGHPNVYKRIKKDVRTLDGEMVEAWVYEYQRPIRHGDTTTDYKEYIGG